MVSEKGKCVGLGIQNSVAEWNRKYPLDRHWRKAYSIPFGSKAHRKACQVDIYFEFVENVHFECLSKSLELIKEDADNFLLDNRIFRSKDHGKTLAEMNEITQEEFDNIEIGDLEEALKNG